MKCTAKVCSYWATIPNVNCTGEMIEVGGINKQYQYLDKDGVVCEAEVKLYQCESCKSIKLC